MEDSEEPGEVTLLLERLGERYPRYARVVELRHFGGFSLEETAEILGVSRATVAREWALARALLQEALDYGG